MSRRFAREIALQVLFQLDLTKDKLDIEENIKRWAAEFAMPEVSLPFARELVFGTMEHLAEIDDKIRSLSEEWALERMAGVDRNVLRLAAFEILHRPDIPGRVTLNEAIEVAKKFGGAESAKFVNGILDRLAAGIGKNEDKKSSKKKLIESNPAAANEGQAIPANQKAGEHPQ